MYLYPSGWEEEDNCWGRFGNIRTRKRQEIILVSCQGEAEGRGLVFWGGDDVEQLDVKGGGDLGPRTGPKTEPRKKPVEALIRWLYVRTGS